MSDLCQGTAYEAIIKAELEILFITIPGFGIKAMPFL